jgi:hypothetical protein
MSSSAAASPANATGSGSSAGGMNLRIMPRPGYFTNNLLDMGETCSFLQVDSRGCRAPRSCRSCLENMGCMINTIGKCVSPQDELFEPELDYHNAIAAKLVVTDAQQAQSTPLRASQRWQFRSDMVRYCSATDATCRACTQANFWRPGASFPDSRFCLGDDGACVCIDVCERRYYVQPDCGSYATAPSMLPSNFDSETLVERLWRGLLSVAIFVGIVVLAMLRKQYVAKRTTRLRQQELARQQEARQARRHATSRSLGVDPLTLTGWESHRRDLIDKEAAQLAGKGDESKTGEVHSDESSEDEHGTEIRSPRAAGGSSSTAYVSLEESGPGNTTTRSPSPGLSAYNEATPSRQSLAPLSTRDH